MRNKKNTEKLTLNKVILRECILHSMIDSFKIEGISISEQNALEIFNKVNSKIK